MLRRLISTLFSLLVILFVGRLLMSIFPEARGIWEEVKAQAVYLYHLSVANIGVIGTLIIIIAAVSVFGASRR